MKNSPASKILANPLLIILSHLILSALFFLSHIPAFQVTVTIFLSHLLVEYLFGFFFLIINMMIKCLFLSSDKKGKGLFVSFS